MTLTDQEVIEKRDDIEMMNRPNLWPHYPVLPMKKREAGPDGSPPCGVLVKYADGYRVYDTLLPMMKSGILRDVLKDIPFTAYANAEAVSDDGWWVD